MSDRVMWTGTYFCFLLHDEARRALPPANMHAPLQYRIQCLTRISRAGLFPVLLAATGIRSSRRQLGLHSINIYFDASPLRSGKENVEAKRPDLHR